MTQSSSRNIITSPESLAGLLEPSAPPVDASMAPLKIDPRVPCSAGSICHRKQTRGGGWIRRYDLMESGGVGEGRLAPAPPPPKRRWGRPGVHSRSLLLSPNRWHRSDVRYSTSGRLPGILHPHLWGEKSGASLHVAWCTKELNSCQLCACGEMPHRIFWLLPLLTAWYRRLD